MSLVKESTEREASSIDKGGPKSILIYRDDYTEIHIKHLYPDKKMTAIPEIIDLLHKNMKENA